MHIQRAWHAQTDLTFAKMRQSCKTAVMNNQSQTSPALISAGRWLIALYFFVPGIMKFLAMPMHVGLMTFHKVPFPLTLLIVAGVVQVIGAVLLFANRFVRFTALGFVIYTLLINFLLHDFWNFEGLVAGHEMQNFIKNLGIVAGLLVLAGASTWRMPGFKGLMVSDNTSAHP
jgi:putative oxidoreductase